jgi:hypothetical protein
MKKGEKKVKKSIPKGPELTLGGASVTVTQVVNRNRRLEPFESPI